MEWPQSYREREYWKQIKKNSESMRHELRTCPYCDKQFLIKNELGKWEYSDHIKGHQDEISKVEENRIDKS